MERVTVFILGSSEITADGDCKHEIKRHFTPWKKIYDQSRQHIKSRDVILPRRVHLVKAMIFPVVVCEYESWTIKKAEHQRIDAFERWCWRWLLRVPWTTRRSNQSFLEEASPEYLLEGLILKLKVQYFGYMMQRADSFKKILIWEGLKAGGEGDDRGWDGWMASPTQWTWVWVTSRNWWWTGRPGALYSP